MKHAISGLLLTLFFANMLMLTVGLQQTNKDCQMLKHASSGNTINQLSPNVLGPAFMGPHPEKMPIVRPNFALDYYPGIYFEEDVKKVRPYLEDLHALGIKYFTYNAFDHVEHPLSGLNVYEKVPELVEKATVINLDGERITDYMEPGFYQHSILRSFYRDFLVNITKRAIDAGADGVVFDVAICLDSFDPESMEGFRNFLSSRYNETFLLENYNITDISSFDYGQYLRDRGYNASRLAQEAGPGGEVPLWDEWELYKVHVEREFFKRLSTELRSYATENYGRDFYITANRYWSNRQFATSNYVSFLSGETFIEDINYPNGTLVPMYKLALALNKGFWSWNMPNSSHVELTKLFIAEAYALMGIVYGTDPGTSGITHEGGVSANTAPYHLFAISHPEIFSNVSEDSEIAIFYSVPTHKRDYVDQQTAFRGAVYLLADSHLTFDVIIGGDNDWINDTLSLDKVSKYKAIFLPDTKCLTDNQVAVLMNYLAAGGVLIGTGGNIGGVSGLEIGRYDENWIEVNRSEWNALFTGGIQSYGNGTVISWTEDIPSIYYQYTVNGNTTGKNMIRSEFLSNLSSLLTADISTDLPPEIHIFKYRQSDGSEIYHLVNYLYNSSIDLVKRASGNLCLPIPEGWEGDIYVSMMTPEAPDPTVLPFSISDGKINFSLDEIGIWTVIKVGSPAQEAQPPDYEPISRVENWDQGRFWWNKPVNLSFYAVDDHNLSRINFHYRYSQDNISWSDWTFYASRNVSGSSINGTFTFDPSSLLGEGYYDIFVQAVDDKGQLAHMLNRAKLRGGFDVTPPPSPIVTEVHGVQNDTWQYRIYDPEFIWYQPPDNLAGINEFYLYWVYWGPPGNPQWYFTNGKARFDPKPLPSNETSVYYLYIALVDNAGNWNNPLEGTGGGSVFVFRYAPDTTPPVTTSDYDGLWHNTNFTITLTATDNETDVAETYYRINNGPIKAVSINGQPLITTEGINTLEYWSIDEAGNEEPHKFLTAIKLDKTLPVIASHSRFPEDNVEPNQPVKITVNVTDSLSGVKNVTLSYRIRGESAWNNILMTLNQTSMLYEATIIIHQPNVDVEYMITAYDNAGNKIVENNSGQCYSYSVVPEYPLAFMPLLIMLGISLVFIIATKKKRMRNQLVA